MNQPRIFIGTLASGEAELNACCAAIASQQSVVVTHHIIHDQPEFEAHNQLWAAWDRAKPDHDLFVKVDADTVLNRPTALAEIAALFKTPDITGAQILLHDYFTDDLISGLNCFSCDVVFKPAKTRLYADHSDSGHKTILKGSCVAHLAPIGWHGQNPHPRQAFYYGFHRKLKNQHDTIARVAYAWQQHQDDARAWALAGAASARWWHFKPDYHSMAFTRAFHACTDDHKRLNLVRRFINRNIPSQQEIAA
jgi:hypothetical protein